MASRVVGRRRARPTLRSVQGTVRFRSEPLRRLASATLQTYGARYVRAEWLCGVAWLWTFQGIGQTSHLSEGNGAAACTTVPGGPRGNQHALKHGRYTARAIAARRAVRELIRALRAALLGVNW